MREVYKSLQLLGYKIKEFSNGYFVGKRPDGRQGLFSTDGRLVMGNFEEVKQISDELYCGLKDARITLFNRQGNILEEASSEDNWEDISTLGASSHTVCIFKSADLSEPVSIYSSDGKAHFNRLNYSECNIVNNNGKYKLVYSNREPKSPSFKIINTDGSIEIIKTSAYKCIDINNHFINKVNLDDTNTLLDFKGNTVYEGYWLVIDNVNLDNDTVVKVEGNTLEIKSTLMNIDTKYENDYKITRLSFTTNKDIIKIEDEHGNYLLNIKTMQRTSYNINATYLIGNIVASRTYSLNTTIYRLNLDTFELAYIDECDYFTFSKEHIVTESYEGTKYYNLEFEPLIHEFD